MEENQRCQTCEYFPCTKVECNILGKIGCEDWKSYIGEEQTNETSND